MTKIKNRIVGSGEEALDQIMFNPRNWRIHPLNQQNALKGVLEEVGWVQQVIVNKRTGNLVDGHLRCQLAAREGATTIPVVYIDVSEEEEALVLATLDPIMAMAVTEREQLKELLGGLNTDNKLVEKLIKDIAINNEIELENKKDKYGIGIVKPAWGDSKEHKFFSIRAWTVDDKKQEIQKLKEYKDSLDDDFINYVAEEVAYYLINTFNRLDNFVFTSAPPHRKEINLSNLVAEKTAEILGSEYKLMFEADKEKARHIFGDRSEIKLISSDIPREIVFFDDVYTTGRTLNSCLDLLVGAFVIPIIWIYRSLLE